MRGKKAHGFIIFVAALVAVAGLAAFVGRHVRHQDVLRLNVLERVELHHPVTAARPTQRNTGAR